MAARAHTVVVDTNVFSADLLRSTRPLVELYRPLLAGRRYLISFQTLAEIRYGLRRRDWGQQRLERAEAHIGRAEVVWPGPALLAAQVDLRLACERVGHALGQRHHEVDRWIAATASLGLRARDPAVVERYAAHGHIRGGATAWPWPRRRSRRGESAVLRVGPRHRR